MDYLAPRAGSRHRFPPMAFCCASTPLRRPFPGDAKGAPQRRYERIDQPHRGGRL